MYSLNEARIALIWRLFRPQLQLFEIEAAGGTYVEASEGFDNAHVDGHLVTAPAWPAHPNWIRALLGLLGTRIAL